MPRRTANYSKDERNEVITLHLAGNGLNSIVNIVAKPYNFVQRTVAKLKAGLGVDDLPRSGRPPKTSLAAHCPEK